MNNQQIDLKITRDNKDVGFSFRRLLRVRVQIRPQKRGCLTKASIDRRLIKHIRKRQISFTGRIMRRERIYHREVGHVSAHFFKDTVNINKSLS